MEDLFLHVMQDIYFLAALHPGLLAHQLGRTLRALLNGADAVPVAGRFVAWPCRILAARSNANDGCKAWFRCRGITRSRASAILARRRPSSTLPADEIRSAARQHRLGARDQARRLPHPDRRHPAAVLGPLSCGANKKPRWRDRTSTVGRLRAS
jgi:hypothetical protein